ncbi:MAG: STAS domain-containing protein [Deltaproteobacteria bacterium]|nr:STAS domain-containing protein [Deltaproteobacteria bacterium]
MTDVFDVAIVDGKGIIKVSQNLMSELPAELLRNAFEDLLERGQKSVVIDLTQTISINSYGLGRILMLLNKAKEQSGSLAVRVAPGYVKEIIKLLFLDKVIPIEEI